MIAITSFVLLNTFTAANCHDWTLAPSDEDLARYGWPMLPEGETPITIALPGSIEIQYCSQADSCEVRQFSVLQDGGYRATQPEPQGRVLADSKSLGTTFNGDNRFYFGLPHLADSSKPIVSFEKDYVAAFDLRNKKWEFEVDLSSVGCNCDASMYFYSRDPSMSDTNSVTDPMRNSWYLDAQSTPGVPEVDILEGCSYQTTSSLHTCKTSSNGSYSGCRGMGELWRALSPLDLFNKRYGPGGSKIDTKRAFNVSASFPVDKDTWTMEVTLSQASKTLSGSVQKITSRFKDKPRSDLSSLQWMRPAMSLWGNPSNGIQMTPFYAPQCSPFTGCDFKAAKALYSNFKLSELKEQPELYEQLSASVIV